jgi:uncharacterized membrane protein
MATVRPGDSADRAGANAAARGRPGLQRRSITFPGILLGLGLGGFVDGIVLHQILQWHHMRTGDGAFGDTSMTTVVGLEANTLADGLFHVGTWALTVAGVFWLRAVARDNRGLGSWTELVGLLLAGWGLFNLVEGLVDHQILGVHHVRDDIGAPLGWDLAFLASGVILIVIGFKLARGRRDHGSPQ